MFLHCHTFAEEPFQHLQFEVVGQFALLFQLQASRERRDVIIGEWSRKSESDGPLRTSQAVHDLVVRQRRHGIALNNEQDGVGHLRGGAVS